jgi:hypothetical protein
MPDLGELEILERPLIIHEAKAGGRKLTKSLFRQLPDWQDIKERLILPDCPADVVAWVEYHWRDCDDAKYNFYASGDHRHILLSDSGTPYRGTVWDGPTTKGIIPLSLGDITGSDPVGDNMAALLARQRLKGKIFSLNIFRGNGEIIVTHKERDIRFRCGGETGQVLFSAMEVHQDSHDATKLREIAQLLVEESDLVASLDQFVTEEVTYRSEVEEVWRLVTTETPQVFV